MFTFKNLNRSSFIKFTNFMKYRLIFKYIFLRLWKNYCFIEKETIFIIKGMSLKLIVLEMSGKS